MRIVSEEGRRKHAPVGAVDEYSPDDARQNVENVRGDHKH